VTIPDVYDRSEDGFITFPDKTQNKTLLLVDLPQGVYVGKSVNIKLQKKDSSDDSESFDE
jgi:chondroitin AC lyase